MIKQAYINGFMRRCAIRGINPERLIKLAAVTTWDPDINMPSEPVKQPEFTLPEGNTVTGVVPIIPAAGSFSASSTAAAQRAAAEAARIRGAAAAAERARRVAWSELSARSPSVPALNNASGGTLAEKLLGMLGVGVIGTLFSGGRSNTGVQDKSQPAASQVYKKPQFIDPKPSAATPRTATKLELN